MSNNNFIKKRKFLVHEDYTRESRGNKVLAAIQSRKRIRSTKLPDGKLET